MEFVGQSTPDDFATKEPGRTEPAAAAPASRPSASEEASPVDQAILERILTLANAYRSEGSRRQAMDLYWKLAEDYPGTPQSDVARAVLLDLASGYEVSGDRHMARSIYEHLL